MTRNSCQYCRLKKCFGVGMSRGGKLFSSVLFYCELMMLLWYHHHVIKTEMFDVMHILQMYSVGIYLSPVSRCPMSVLISPL